jgi:protein-S-isoprenylcysteine O-methyltransferase Ste14
MPSLESVILIIWAVFWLYWLISALGATKGSRGGSTRPPGLVILAAFVSVRVFGAHGMAVHQPILQVVGMTLFLSGLAFAVWARVCLGRNWGMPMTRKLQPQLVTAGPYHFVRHPIYSGILLAVLGTSLAIDLYWLIVFALVAVYFLYSARVEEELLTGSFPTTYPHYKTTTKMLIPFVL